MGFIPQVIKGFVTKKVDDVAFWQPVLLGTGMTLWIIYGAMLNDWPILATNILAVSCNIIIIIQKFMYRGYGNV